MATGMLGVFAAAISFSADIILTSYASRAHVTQGQEIGLNRFDIFINILNTICCFHIRYYIHGIGYVKTKTQK